MKGLGRLLWVLVRVILFVLTGEWVGGKPGEESAQPAPGAPRPVAGVPRPPPRALPAEQRTRLGGWLEAARVRAAALRAAALSTRGGSPLARALDETITPELVLTRRQLDAATAPPGLEERVQGLDDALAGLEGALEARRGDPGKGLSAADTESVLTSAAAPLYEYLQTLPDAARERLVIAVPRDKPRMHQRAAQHTRLLFVRSVQEEPARLGQALRSLARTLVDDLALVPDLLAAHGLPPSLFVPPPGASYDVDTARGSLGVWLPELAADVLATFMFGPAYARHLARGLARPVAPLETRAGTLAARWLSQNPPALLRVYAACRALDALGFTSEATSIEHDFRAQHPAPELLLLPRADGSTVAVAESFLLDQLELVLDDLLTEPHRGLGGSTLLDVPGFAFLHGEDAEARAAAERFLRGSPTVHGARVCGAGALRAMLDQPELAPAVLVALSRSVRGAGTLEAISQPEAADAARPVGSFITLSRNRGELRAALALGAAFERPRKGLYGRRVR